MFFSLILYLATKLNNNYGITFFLHKDIYIFLNTGFFLRKIIFFLNLLLLYLHPLKAKNQKQ